ncbi:MAG TPA: ATP-dependent DNA ligase [Candidatus Saccharimonadales bacterium]|nr:ATP-dependent DNA ligase [Candidatus Saccharimonadales bacterium]
MTTLAELARAGDMIAQTSSKSEKVRLLARFVAGTDDEELAQAARYFAGSVFPSGDERTLQVGGAAFSTVLRNVSGADDATIRAAWRRHSDAGDVTGDLLSRLEGRESEAMSLGDLDSAFAAIAGARVARERTALLTGLLQRASPDDARYIAKLITGELRIGLREGLVEEAIAVAFDADPEAVSRAVMLTGDLGEAALLAKAARLDDAAPRWFVPLRSMLATPVASAAEAVARLGDDVWVEDKYDGIRCQLHRRGADVALFSRDLKNISAQFPEITAAAMHLRIDVMLDGEILAFHDGRVMPFHALQTRLGRVSPDAAVMAAVPVIYVSWDVLMVDDEVLIDHPLRERRARLEALTVPHPLALAHLERVRGEAEIDRRFDDARARLNEGLLLKQPESPYTPGRRGLNWLKLKRPLDTLDVVVVGAEWGHGKRRGVLSDVTFAVLVDGTDQLATIGKAYTGLTDSEIAEMTALLLDITVADHGHYRTVEPRIVLEIAFDAVQFSGRHKSGFALRFPRIARWRHDKAPSDIDALSRVRDLATAIERDRVQLVDQTDA